MICLWHHFNFVSETSNFKVQQEDFVNQAKEQPLRPGYSHPRFAHTHTHTHVYRIAMPGKDRHKDKSSEQWKYKVQNQTLYT